MFSFLLRKLNFKTPIFLRINSATHFIYSSSAVPPNFVMSPINQTIPKGKTAIFSCQATGIPAPSIKWYKSQNLITNDVRFTVSSNGTLVVKSVSELDSGWFTCRATNDAGTSEKRVYFLVAGIKKLHLVVTLLFK